MSQSGPGPRRDPPGAVRWGRFGARRLLRLAALLCATTLGAFMLMVASPIDPVQAYVGADLARLGPEQRAAIESAWGLDQPLLTRLFAWATTLATGDLGHSIVFHQPVTQVIAERFIASLALMTVAWVLSAVLGFAMGALAGWFHGRWPDRIVTWWAYTLASAPTFWVGLLLLYVFAVTLGIAPVCCSAPIGSLASDVPLWQRLHHLVLPALTVSIVGVAPVALHTRHAVIETLGSDHISLARAQGERGWGLARHHVLRNAAGPALMLSFASFGELFGGSVLAEQVFSYPGLGEATVTAALRQDVPLLLGVVMFTTVFVYAGNLIGDVVHHVSDPRVPLEPERRPS